MPTPPRAGQRDDPGRTQGAGHSGDVVLAPDQAPGQQRRVPGRGRRIRRDGLSGPLLRTGPCLGRGRRKVERGVLPEHPGLEVLQVRGRLQPELLVEPLPVALMHGEGIGLARGPVQGEHQLGMWSLAQRVRRDDRLQSGDRRVSTAEKERRLDPVLRRCGTQLLQACRLRAGEVLIDELRVRRPTPEVERLVEQPCCLGRLGGQHPLRPRGQLGKQPRIQVVGPHPEQIARRPGEDRDALLVGRIGPG